VSFSTWVSFLPQRIFFEKRILQNCFTPSECPFQWGSLSSLSASLLGNAFEKTSSSLRLSLSTWVAFLLQRIIFEKCIKKIAFFPQSVLFDLGLFPPSAHHFWEVYLKLTSIPQSVLFDLGFCPSQRMFLRRVFKNGFLPSECPFRRGSSSSLRTSFFANYIKKTIGPPGPPRGPWFPWAPWCSLEQSRLLPSEQPFLKTIFKKTPGPPRGPCFPWAPWFSFDQNHLPPSERPCLKSALKKPPGYASQKGCVEGGKRPTSKRTLWGRKVTF
jgi:hypothetical protein